MSNIRLRLIFFFAAFPSLIAMILFLPFGGHLAFALLVTVFAGAAAVEVAKIFRNRGAAPSLPAAFILGAAGPFAAYLKTSGLVPVDILPGFFVLAAAALMTRDIFHPKEEDFREVLFRLAAYIFVMMYPGLFCSYVIRMISLPAGSTVLLVFIAGTYLNDSAAWASGMLWGKNNRNILTVSPNKSLQGFIGGFFASILIVVGAAAALPGYFPVSIGSAVLLGCALGTTTILGDLAESSLKRSGALKDSGKIIPGRGGILDSIDSPMFSAPFFYYLYLLLASGSV